MPIYAYRCDTCGYAKDVLQKISDPVLSVCPNCGASTFRKQVTAAGFQLKGSGWYVTDFRGGDNKGAKPAADAPAAAPAATGSSGSESTAAPAPAASSDKPAASEKPAAAPPPATPGTGAK